MFYYLVYPLPKGKQIKHPNDRATGTKTMYI